MKKNTVFILILFSAIICQLSVDNYLPSLPYLTQLFHAQAATLRMTVVIFMFGAGIASFFFGILSDTLGRKKSFMLALSCFLLGNLLCLLAQDPIMLMLGRFLQGIGTGGCLTLVRVVLCDVCDEQSELAYLGSYLSMAISIIPTISPTLGAYIFVHLGWRSNFILLFITALMAILLTWKFLPETHSDIKPTATKQIFIDIKHVMTHSIFMGYLICAGLMTTAALGLMSIGPHLFQVALHLSPIQYGYATFFIGLSMILGSYGNALLIKRLGLRKTVKTGLVIIILSSVAMLAAYFIGYFNIFVILIPAMLYLFGGDFISTNAYAGAMSSLKAKAGTATALYTSLQLLLAGIVGFIIAYLPDQNQLPIALIFFLIAAILFFIIRFVLWNSLESKS